MATYSISDPYLRRVAEIESNLNPMAKNPNSSAKGLFQFIDSTAKAYGLNDPFDPDASLQAAQKLTADNRKALKQSLGREPTSAELYLAHQQGATGAAKLLKNPDLPVSQVIGKDQALLNAGAEEMTAGQFANQWLEKFGTIEGEQSDEVLMGGQADDIPPLPEGFTLDSAEAPEVPPLPEGFTLDTEQIPEQEPPNFGERVVPTLMDRAGRMGQSLGRLEEVTGFGGGQGVPETAFQVGGEALLGAGDVLGNLAISGYRALPQAVREPIQQVGGAALRAAGSLPTGFGGQGTLAESIPQELGALTQGFENLEQQSPRTAANLRSALAFGTALSPTKAVDVVGKGMRTTGQGLKETAKQLRKVIPEPKNVSAAQLREQAGKIYQSLDELGASVKGQKLTNLADDIQMEIRGRGRSLPAEARMATQKLADPENKVRQAQDIFESLRDQDLTLEGFKTIDQDLGEIAYASSTPEAARRQILSMQRKMRDMVEKASPDDMTNPEVFEAYKGARELWAKQARIRDLETITAKAFATDQPTNALKRSLKRFLADDSNLRGFSDAEIAAIKKTSETGIGGELLRSVMGRLPERVALGSGQPLLSPVLTAASSGARSFADDMSLRKMGNISNLIASGQTTPTSLPRTLGNLSVSGLETGGDILENLYSGQRGRLATLGTIQGAQQ